MKLNSGFIEQEIKIFLSLNNIQITSKGDDVALSWRHQSYKTTALILNLNIISFILRVCRAFSKLAINIYCYRIVDSSQIQKICPIPV